MKKKVFLEATGITEGEGKHDCERFLMKVRGDDGAYSVTGGYVDGEVFFFKRDDGCGNGIVELSDIQVLLFED